MRSNIFDPARRLTHMRNIATLTILCRAGQWFRRHRNNTVTKFAIALFAFASGLAAQGTPNLSGYWELTFDSRSVPLANLTAAAASADRSEQAQHDADAIRWCHYFGVPYVME